MGGGGPAQREDGDGGELRWEVPLEVGARPVGSRGLRRPGSRPRVFIIDT